MGLRLLPLGKSSGSSGEALRSNHLPSSATKIREPICNARKGCFFNSYVILKCMEPEKNGNYWQHEEDMNLEPEQIEEPQVDDEPELDTAEEYENGDTPTAASDTINWDAKEHITHQRGSLWFVVLVLAALALLALSIFLLKSYTFAALIVVSVIALLVYVKRPPRDIHYSLSNKGLQIDDKVHDFDQYKAFGVLKDGSYFSIILIPKKHFAPAATVYFPENQGESIVDLFGSYLPMQEVKLDAVDRLIRKLRI